MLESLKKIRDAEQAAHRKVLQARQQAEEILKNAEHESKTIVQNAVHGARDEADALFKSVCSKAEQQACELLATGTREIESLRAKAEAHIDDAAIFIMRRIMGDI